jgi:hypothetical protein
LLLNLFKLTAIEFEFGNGHSGDYSEGGPAPWRAGFGRVLKQFRDSG